MGYVKADYLYVICAAYDSIIRAKLTSSYLRGCGYFPLAEVGDPAGNPGSVASFRVLARASATMVVATTGW